MLKLMNTSIALLVLVICFGGCEKRNPESNKKEEGYQKSINQKTKEPSTITKPPIETTLSDLYLIREDFEGTQLNKWPSKWSPDANVKSDPNKNRISRAPHNSENQVLKMHGAVGGCWGSLGYYPCDFPNSFTVELMVFNGSEKIHGCHPDRASLAMRHGTYWHYKTNPSFALLNFDGAGVIKGAGGQVVSDYQTNCWYHVRIDYFRKGEDVTLKYWIDDQYVTTITCVVKDIDTHLSLDHFQLSVNEGSAFFDDVILYAHSEKSHLSQIKSRLEEKLLASPRKTETEIANIEKELSSSNIGDQAKKYEQTSEYLKKINAAAQETNRVLLKARLNNETDNK